MNEKNLFDNIELNTAENTDVSIKDVIMDDTPQITSLEWNDYVMSLFEEDELIENRPLSAGLRRVSELVLGRIVSSGPVQVFHTVPMPSPQQRPGQRAGLYERLLDCVQWPLKSLQRRTLPVLFVVSANLKGWIIHKVNMRIQVE